MFPPYPINYISDRDSLYNDVCSLPYKLILVIEINCTNITLHCKMLTFLMHTQSGALVAMPLLSASPLCNKMTVGDD